MKKYSTKRALIASILMLALCCSALLGTTYAWFTDSVTSSGNVIQSGTLKIGFDKWDGTKWVDATNAPVFDYDKWEPGYIQNVNLRVTNLGTLALKWQAVITTENSLSALADVIDVYVNAWGVLDDTDASAVTAPIDRNLTGYTLVGTLADFVENFTTTTYGTLLADENAYLGIALKMKEEAGNEYQGLDLGGKFDLTILATQYTYEEDSFDKTYDALAEFPHFVHGVANVIPASTAPYVVELINFKGGKQGSATVFASSVDSEATSVSATVKKVPTPSNFTVYDEATQSVTTLDVTVTGLVAGNTTPVVIETHLPAGLTNVKLYHYDQEIPCTYKEVNGVGVLKFESATFSPFNVVYDTIPSEEVTPAPGDDKPMAIVTENKELENITLAWNDSLGIMPSDINQALEAVYTFKAPHNNATVQDSGYANWYCDFYVMCSGDAGSTIPEGALVLGGNYGEWGWIGFDSPEVDANVEIPLLGSVTNNPWTYEDVVSFVETFICGVAHNDHELDGEKFTVALRLTNPENENDYYDAATITYTFPTCGTHVEDNATLEDAIVGADASVVLGNGTYVMPSTTQSKELLILGSKNSVLDITKGAYLDNANVTIKGVTIKTSTGYVMDAAGNTGSDYAALYSSNTTYIDCTFVGPMRLGRDGAKFINCTFTELGNDYIWTYGNDVTFEGCTFNTDGKAILIYSDGGNEVSNVTVKNCTFNATQGAKAGAIANQNCAAIEIHNYGNGVNLVTENNTYSSNFSGEWRIKTYEVGRTQIIVNGIEYTTIAIDGKTMTKDSANHVTVNG